MLLTLETNIKPIYAHSIEEFNEYVDKYKTDNQMIITKAGNISQANLRNMPCSKTWKRGNRMEFQYLDSKQQIRVLYALHYDEKCKEETDENIAYEALNYFKGLMDLIPTDDEEEDTEMFTCPENPTSAYYNYINERYTDYTVNHCYSLDRNNSFPASMMTVYPQTKEYVEKYYQERLAMKGKPGYERFKVYGSIFVGWLKRKHRERAWKKIVSNSNQVVHNLRLAIEKAGNTILLVNTDAVKFIDHFDYQENTNLGGFKYEWQDTKMYIKGVKSYAYLDKDKWKFKQAGKCRLDNIKPNRDTWTLDDFICMDTIETSNIRIRNGRLVEIYE